MMLLKLSLKNIKKSFKDYAIYFITLIFGISIFYMFNSIDSQTALSTLTASKYEIVQALVQVLGYVSIFVSIILVFLIIYANNFLLKRRKKELGLYMTLGMNKFQIVNMLLVETIIVGVISLVIGLLIGIFASQFISVLVINIFEANIAKFEFVFSIPSFIKTCSYFAIIYVLVMLFNIFSISKSKLIKLLNANKTNEKIKVKNKWVAFSMFILAILLIGIAYYLLKHNALMKIDYKFIIMLITGAIGTFFLFASMAAFLMEVVKLNKKLYYKNLNMFVLRQISNKINTTTISMTIISLMLLLTIIILSASISMSQSTNKDIVENNLSDFTIKKSNYPYSDTSENIRLNNGLIDDFYLKNIDFEKYVTKYVEYNKYIVDDEKLNTENIFDKEQMDKLTKKYNKDMINFDVKPTFIKESEYNNLMELYNKEDLKVNLKKEEYVILSDFQTLNDLIVTTLKNKTPININGCKLTPKYETPIAVAIENAEMNSVMCEIVIKDELINENMLVESVICGNFAGNDDESTFKNFEKYLKDNYYTTLKQNKYIYFNTAFEIKNTAVGVSAIMTFLGLYLGIIFAITSAAVLALIQLSESSDNKERFTVLEKIGADEKMINKALFKQIGIFFMFPIAIALIHSIVGLSEVNRLISIFGSIDLTSNILITTLFIFAVYGGYFIVTYFCSKNIIHEKK